MDVVVELTYSGAGGFEGLDAALIYPMGLQSPHPLKFYALYLTL